MNSKKQYIRYWSKDYVYVIRSDVLLKAKRILNVTNLRSFLLSNIEHRLILLFYCVQWKSSTVSLEDFLESYRKGFMILNRSDQYSYIGIQKLLLAAIRKFRIDN